LPYTLISSTPIGQHRVQRNDESRVLVVDSLLVRFTPTEYRLLIPLLEGLPVHDNDLVSEVFSCKVDSWACECLNKHIDKIRNKLRPLGLNVHRIAKYGYILLAIVD
jgi:DNA-binding winged helix-turn-helix (wHTH) protein